MLKKQMENLMAGQVVLDTRNNVELEIVGVGETKVILINGKEYSKSTLKRYFKLVEQQIPEVVEPDNTILDDIEQADELTSEQDTTADTDTTAQDTTATTTTNTAVNEIQGEQDTTAINGAEILANSISGVVLAQGCYLKRMKQYIAVRSNNVKGTLVYIRIAKEGGWHFDVGKTTWNKLDTDTQVDLVEQFDACIKDKTRGLWRISNCDSLPVFEKLLTTALDIA